ncbi:MAG TPA: Gfo/Idh/MocA family oxidoreductase, partial [Spirochaetia bacterium]|nr:Gfo/Idh/MocA family oxidoreductase [Spirochaetia bacterium]
MSAASSTAGGRTAGADGAVRVGVIGCGPIGNLHARLYAGMDHARLVGVCDVLPERARACGELL